jgi:hypothetical protein
MLGGFRARKPGSLQAVAARVYCLRSCNFVTLLTASVCVSVLVRDKHASANTGDCLDMRRCVGCHMQQTLDTQG